VNQPERIYFLNSSKLLKVLTPLREPESASSIARRVSALGVWLGKGQSSLVLIVKFLFITIYYFELSTVCKEIGGIASSIVVSGGIECCVGGK